MARRLVPAESWGYPPGRMLRRLSPREREVVALLTASLTRRAIGARLGVSPATVRHHVGIVCLKLGIRGGGRGLVAWLRNLSR